MASLPVELWKEIINILTNPKQYWDDGECYNVIGLDHFIPLQLNILCSISKQINKISQQRLKIVKNYVGEYRNIPLLQTPDNVTMFKYFANFGSLSLIKEARTLGYEWDEDIKATIAVQASATGQLEVIKYLHDSGCDLDHTEVHRLAASHSTEVLKFIHEIGIPWNHRECVYAAESGSLERLKYLHENGCEWDELTCTAAAGSKSLECLIYAHENGCAWSGQATVEAARSGNIEALIYLHEHGCPWDKNTCSEAVEVKNNSLECLTYVHKNGAPLSRDTCKMAAARRNLPCLKYARENGFEWTDKVINHAAKAGSLECLKYAVENGLLMNDEVYNHAAKAGSLACLKYLHENGCPGGYTFLNCAIPPIDILKYVFEVLGVRPNRASLLEAAVIKLSEECLQYLIDRGVTWRDEASQKKFTHELAADGDMLELKLALKYKCQIDPHTICTTAAKQGDMYILKYLHESGYPWDIWTCHEAVKSGSLECVQYLIENGCPWEYSLCNDVPQFQSAKILKCLHQQGYPIGPGTVYLAAHGKSFECLKYAHENGSEWHEETLARAALITNPDKKQKQMTESLKIIEYAYERGCPLHRDVAQNAASTGNLFALKWAHEHGANWPASVCTSATLNNQHDCLDYIHANNTCPNPKCYVNLSSLLKRSLNSD